MIENIAAAIIQDKDLYGDSRNWANWMSELTPTTCKFCAEQHGKIVSVQVLNNKREVRAHLNCLCIYVPMRTKKVGTATNMGYGGADVYLVHYGRLPSYYVLKEDAAKAGWKRWKGNLDKILPGKMIGGYKFDNEEGKLPRIFGRIWYEADIDYKGGYRNDYRILYSNDGLIFVTYDHYKTFYELTR